MTTDYSPGDLIRLQGALTISDVATAPTAAVIYVLRPDNTLLTYLSATGWTSQGAWNAATNTPALADGAGTAGHYYTVSTAGAVNFGSRVITFAVNERVFYDGFYWKRMANIQIATLTAGSTGVFYYDYAVPDITGIYTYAMETIGTGKAAEVDKFNVLVEDIWP